MVAAMSGCASLETGAAYDDSFDAAWMVVIPVDRAALPGYCQRVDRQSLLGCARPHQDAAAGSMAEHLRGGEGGGGAVTRDAPRTGVRGTCVIYVARDLVRDSGNFDLVLRHEARHCRGWRHPGD